LPPQYVLRDGSHFQPQQKVQLYLGTQQPNWRKAQKGFVRRASCVKTRIIRFDTTFFKSFLRQELFPMKKFHLDLIFSSLLAAMLFFSGSALAQISEAQVVGQDGKVGIETIGPGEKFDIRSSRKVADMLKGEAAQSNYSGIKLETDSPYSKQWKSAGSSQYGVGGSAPLTPFSNSGFKSSEVPNFMTLNPYVVDMGGLQTGLWQWESGNWTQITTVVPTSMLTSGSDLYADFTGYGLYTWNGTTWTQINEDCPLESIVVSGTTLYASYMGYGLYTWDGTTWTQINGDYPLASMVASGSILYAEYTG
jgi:hypothetical protein